MSRTKGEALAYSRGYYAGSMGKWPNLQKIPDCDYRTLAVAATELASRIDGFLAVLDDRDEDPVQIEIDEFRDAVGDAIMEARNRQVAAALPAQEEKA